jgi:hypothetical protein
MSKLDHYLFALNFLNRMSAFLDGVTKKTSGPQTLLLLGYRPGVAELKFLLS